MLPYLSLSQNIRTHYFLSPHSPSTPASKIRARLKLKPSCGVTSSSHKPPARFSTHPTIPTSPQLISNSSLSPSPNKIRIPLPLFPQTLTPEKKGKLSSSPRLLSSMDPCPFVRVLVGNLSLKIPAAARPGRSGGVHPSTSPCYCKIRLNKLPYQTSPVNLVPDDNSGGDQNPQTLTLAASFHLSQADLDKIASKAVIFAGKSKLKVAIYTGRRGSTCGVNSGRLLGKVTLSLDLKGVVGKGCVFHNGWVNVGRESKGSSAMLHLTVRSEPDPRFVFEFDGEPECSPQVFQVQGKMRQPVFTCKFSTYRPGDRNLRTR